MADFSKELARVTFERRSAERYILIEEHTSAFKWLLASLLTLNSGALFGLVNATTQPPYFLVSAIAFWIGIVSALGIAWRSQKLNRQYIQQLAQVEQHYAIAAVYGQIDLEKVSEDEEKLSKFRSWSAQAFGWVSLTAFSVGLGFVLLA